MRILLIKTSSMGDLIHVLPAITDASLVYPQIKFDWVVEDSFVEIPRWHKSVDKIIPVALRRWRKDLFARHTRAEWRTLRAQLKEENYDYILDAQGLVKSAFLGFFAKGLRVGLDWESARESLASFAYQRKYSVNFYQHAIHRMRSLFAQALSYPLPETSAKFGIDKNQFLTEAKDSGPYIVFLHGTTWETKLWPEIYWRELAKLITDAGFRIKISGGDQNELARARRIAEVSEAIDVIPRMALSQMASLLAQAYGAVAVDTGFGHLAAALTVPTISLYGPTEASFTGAIGENSSHISTHFACSPCFYRVCKYQGPSEVHPACFATLPPTKVWAALKDRLHL